MKKSVFQITYIIAILVYLLLLNYALNSMLWWWGNTSFDQVPLTVKIILLCFIALVCWLFLALVAFPASRYFYGLLTFCINKIICWATILIIALNCLLNFKFTFSLLAGRYSYWAGIELLILWGFILGAHLIISPWQPQTKTQTKTDKKTHSLGEDGVDTSN